jgi:hypothetical protein
MKCYFIKRDDCILEGDKQQSTFSFSLSTNKFLSFFISKMNVEESFIKKLQRQSKERLQKLNEEKKKQRE